MSPDDRELASLKREIDEVRSTQKELRATIRDLTRERETFIDTIAKRTPVSRRQMNALVATLGITGAVSYLASEGVLAAGESWGSSTGTNGTDSEPLANANIQDLDVQTLATESIEIDGDYHYAGSDVELDTAISDATGGDVIILGNATFSDSRTITKRLSFRGTTYGSFNGTSITGSWTLDDRIEIQHVTIGATMTLNAAQCVVRECGLSGTPSPTVDIAANACAVIGCQAGSVTFQSGTSDGLADSNWAGTSITDDGNNTVGDNG